MFSTVISIVAKYQEGLLSGLLVTLFLSLIVWSTGILFGTLLGFLASKQKSIGSRLVNTLSFFLASIPILVLLVWAHYPLQELLGVVIYPFITAAFVLSILNIVAVAQIVREALNQFPEQYRIAGKVCGMTPRAIFISIELPIILRQILAPLLTQQVNILQMTLFASVISVGELFRVAQQINSLEYKPIEIYTALALFFLAICLPLNILASWLKSRFTRDFSEK